MTLFNKIIAVSLVCISVNAVTLKDLITNTIENNQNVQSLKLTNQSYNKSYESVKNSYNPNLIVGVNYSQIDGEQRAVQIGKTTVGFAKFSCDLYNGNKNISLKKQKEYEYKNILENTNTIIRETLLQVITLYFQEKTVEENIKVLNEKSIALKAQYERIKTKYNLKMTTIDEVLKFQSEYETNQYNIDELEYNKEELLQTLELLSHTSIDTLQKCQFKEVGTLVYKPSSSIEALQFAIKAQKEGKNIIQSSLRPQIKLEDSYNIYNYDDYNTQILKDLPNKQNQLMLSINFKLFDTSSKQKIEAARLTKLASVKKLEYLKAQEKMKFNLAKKKLHTLKIKIKSLKSSVEMANSVYDMVKIKYENEVVDNITYLDALSKKIYNIALYKQALNDYEIAKANYYFSSGISLKQILSMF